MARKNFFEFRTISQMTRRIAELVVIAQKDAHANGLVHNASGTSPRVRRDDALFVEGGALLANIFARESTAAMLQGAHEADDHSEIRPREDLVRA